MLHLSPVQPITEFLDASEVRNLVHLKGYFKGLLICGIIYLIVFCTMILRYVLFSNNADGGPSGKFLHLLSFKQTTLAYDVLDYL